MKNAVLFDSGLAVISEANGDVTFKIGIRAISVPEAALGHLFTLKEPVAGVVVTNTYTDYSNYDVVRTLAVTREDDRISIDVEGDVCRIGHAESLGLRTALFGQYSYASGFHIDPPAQPNAVEVEEVEHA